MDPAAFPVLGALHAPLLARVDVTVGASASFLLADARLAVLEAAGFAGGEAARLHALLDTGLLVHVPLHIGLHPLRGRGVRVAGLRVVLLAVDVAAHLVLFARKARLFLRGELAVLHGPRLVALDARFLVLEPRRFTGVELAGPEPLLDALLLVDVALNRACLRERCAAKAEGKSCGDHAVCKFHLVTPPSGVVERITTRQAWWRRPNRSQFRNNLYHRPWPKRSRRRFTSADEPRTRRNAPSPSARSSSTLHVEKISPRRFCAAQGRKSSASTRSR